MKSLAMITLELFCGWTQSCNDNSQPNPQRKRKASKWNINLSCAKNTLFIRCWLVLVQWKVSLANYFTTKHKWKKEQTRWLKVSEWAQYDIYWYQVLQFIVDKKIAFAICIFMYNVRTHRLVLLLRQLKCHLWQQSFSTTTLFIEWNENQLNFSINAAFKLYSCVSIAWHYTKQQQCNTLKLKWSMCAIAKSCNHS